MSLKCRFDENFGLIGRATNRSDDRVASCRVNIVLLPTAVAVDVCGVMRREGKGTAQMIEPHPQCSAYPQQQTSQLRLRKN